MRTAKRASALALCLAVAGLLSGCGSSGSETAIPQTSASAPSTAANSSLPTLPVATTPPATAPPTTRAVTQEEQQQAAAWATNALQSHSYVTPEESAYLNGVWQYKEASGARDETDLMYSGYVMCGFVMLGIRSWDQLIANSRLLSAGEPQKLAARLAIINGARAHLCGS